jgi:clan AA aspartic protease (TIGR02281 family)
MTTGGAAGYRWTTFLLAAIIIGLLVWLIFVFLPGHFDRLGDGPGLRYAIVVAVLAGLGLLAGGFGPSLRWAVRLVLLWVGIGLLLMYGYNHGTELASVISDLTGTLRPTPPAAATPAQPNPPTIVITAIPNGSPTNGSAPVDPSRIGSNSLQSVQLSMASDGHFHADAYIGATAVGFLVDTGASNVLLSPGDARRVGYNPAGLAYTEVYHTADGEVRAAPVLLPEIAVGPIRVTNVPASIFEHETAFSLLGMSFLSRLSGYEVNGNMLTLHQ